MKKILAGVLLGLSLLISSTAYADVWVNGYTKANGTYVSGYWRSSPDSNPYNNYSYPGNTNPYTGKTATGNSSSYITNYSSYQPVTPTATTYVPTYTYPTSISSTELVPALKGYVAYENSSCDYFIAYSSSGYALLEWYGGRSPFSNDKIYGNFNSYGFKNLYTGSLPSKTRVWVEDYMLTKNSVIEKYIDKCNL